MVRDGFTLNIFGDFQQVIDKMNQSDYLSILESHVVPSGNTVIDWGFVFQQDNDTKHTFRLCSHYLDEYFRGFML